MNALALALLASVVGVDYGWQINRAGELEYIVQIEPELVARLRDGEKLESEIPADMRNIRRIIVRVGNGPVPRDPLTAQHRAGSATAAPVSHTGARNTAQPATLHQPAAAWAPSTAPRVAQTSTTATPGAAEPSSSTTGFLDGQQYNTNHPLTAAETAAGQIGGTFSGGAFQPARSATTTPAVTPRPATTAGGGFNPGTGFNPGGSFNPSSAPPLTNPATIPPLTGSTPIRSAPPLRNPPLATPATQPGGSAWGGTNPQPAYTPNPGLANPRTAVPHSPAPRSPADIPVHKQPELYTPPERPVVAAPAPKPITPIRDVAPPRVSVPRTDPSMVAAGGALDPSYKPTYPAGGLSPLVASRPPAVGAKPAGSPVSIPAGTPASTVAGAGAVPATISPEIAKDNPATNKLAELTGEKPWWMLTLIAILLFVSIGMNFYLWWVARGIYNRYRRLTAEIRDGAALL